jgi:hypothetical protein
MQSKTPHLLFLLILLFGFQSASAQGEAKIDFRTLGLTRGISSNLFFHNGRAFEELPLAYFRPSREMSGALGEEGQLGLFTKETNEEDEEVFVPYTQIPIPGGSVQILILATHNGNGVSVYAVDDNLSSNDKDWLYINASTTPVAVQLGDGNEPFGVAPGESTFHRANVTSGQGAAIRVAVYKENGWERVYSRFLPIYEGQRSMIIFLQQNGRVTVHNFFEAIKR